MPRVYGQGTYRTCEDRLDAAVEAYFDATDQGREHTRRRAVRVATYYWRLVYGEELPW